MYYCNDCKSEFEELKMEKTTFEDFYGVSNLFPTSHECTLKSCPHCGSDDFEEMETCDRCGEYIPSELLIDTEEYVGGGIGYLCEDCFRDCEVGC